MHSASGVEIPRRTDDRVAHAPVSFRLLLLTAIASAAGAGARVGICLRAFGIDSGTPNEVFERRKSAYRHVIFCSILYVDFEESTGDNSS